MSRFIWKGAITEGTEGTLTDEDEDDEEDEEDEEEEGGEDAGKEEYRGGAEGGGEDKLEDDLAPRACEGETLREFYARTASRWTARAETQEDAVETEAARSGLMTEKQMSKRTKELRKAGFTLCEQSYQEQTG